MCGIGGMVTANGAAPAPQTLDALLKALSHRGPDGEGRHVVGGIGLVHARLAIIDLETGDQPLFGPKNTALVANGEIYNYVELREGLRGVNVRTGSDCELPLHTFAAEGAAFARPLRGMYAIALADPAEDALYLARDPFGIKPLYYAEVPEGLVFASEIRAILASGLVKPALRGEAAFELLQLQFTTGQKTAFEGIQRVRPGETLTVKAGRVVARRREEALPAEGPRLESEEAALAALETALMDSVAVHQRADVPYGMFFSGGIDSTALLVAMARLNASPVRAWTAGFPGTGVADERAHARMLAKRLGAEHIEVEVTARDFWTALPAIAAAVDDPAADYAIIPTWKLAAEAARDLKVVLCGEGGDELFAGYGRYRSLMRPLWLGGRAMRAKGHLDGLGLLRQESSSWRDGIVAAGSRLPVGYTRLQAAQAVDCADWLPHDLLTKLDRCLMAHALEGRTPFLDPAVAGVAFRLPDGLKIRNGLGKYLLRRWLAAALPESEPFAKKRGFTVPVADWMVPEAARLGPMLAREEGVRSLLVPDRVEALFAKLARGAADKREAFAAWEILFFGVWHRVHVAGADPRGTVFDILGSR